MCEDSTPMQSRNDPRQVAHTHTPMPMSPYWPKGG